jgi:hypothetical protein
MFQFRTDIADTLEDVFLEEITVPQGKFFSLDELAGFSSHKPVMLDHKNVLTSGLENYLLAIREGKRIIPVKREGRFSKIDIPNLALTA